MGWNICIGLFLKMMIWSHEKMNICYECMDAQDDFHAQMQKGATSMPHWAEQGSGISEDLDQLAIDDAINVPTDNKLDNFHMSAHLGRSEISCRGLMTDMRRMLVLLGWTDSDPSLVSEDTQGLPADVQSWTPGQWKAAVASKCLVLGLTWNMHLPQMMSRSLTILYELLICFQTMGSNYCWCFKSVKFEQREKLSI